MIGHQNFQNGGANFTPYSFGSMPMYYPPQSPIQNNQTPMNNYPQQDKRSSIQYSGVVQVKTEEEAKGYPVGPGVSVTFKNENEPYMYTKTMGFNQLEQPVFKKYRLVEELDDVEEIAPSHNAEINELRAQINDLRDLIKSSMSKSSSNKRNQKEEIVND